VTELTPDASQGSARFDRIHLHLDRAFLTAAMPYLYCLVLGIGIYALNSALLVGPGSLDIRATALLPLALVAFGQTLAVFTRGTDLSVGGVLSVATALLASHFSGHGVLLVAELFAVVAAAAFAGAINGLIIARTALQPFIVTLSTWSILGGIAILLLPQEGGAVSPQLTSWLTGAIFGVPKSVLIVVLLLLLWVWLRWSRFILDLKAIGSDERRAELVGVKIVRRKVETYMASAVLAALAGVWLAGQSGGGSPVIGNEYILTSVAAVVVGGTSIFGGTGSVAASIAGALALEMIPDLIYALHISSFWTGFVQGALLIVAVTLSSLVLHLRRSRL
jgi:ribose transport system permease protein